MVTSLLKIGHRACDFKGMGSADLYR